MIYIDNINYEYKKNELYKVTIDFTFHGDQIKFSSQLVLTGKEFERGNGDKDPERLIKCIVERELHYLVNGDQPWGQRAFNYQLADE